MPKVVLGHDFFVLVCDGRKALLLWNQGDHVYPKLETRGVFEHKDASTHEMGTDRPSRAFSPADGGRRSAMEQTDLHDQAEQRFLKDIALKLDSEPIKDLIVVAPARALGVLRHEFSATIKKAIRAEIDKDFAHMPAHEIESHVVHALSQG